MRRNNKMSDWSFERQEEELQRLAETREIPTDDHDLHIYPELLASMQELLPLSRSRLMLAVHAIFAWMPTQLNLHIEDFDRLLATMQSITKRPREVRVDDIGLLAGVVQTTRGRSVVAASKLLHFLAPDRFPIWDKYVAERWGKPPSGPRAASDYHAFVAACFQFAEHPVGLDACDTLRDRLARKGYDYPMGRMRLLELIFFLKPR